MSEPVQAPPIVRPPADRTKLEQFGGPSCWVDRLAEGGYRTSYWQLPIAASGIVLPWFDTKRGVFLFFVHQAVAAPIRDTLRTATHARLHSHYDVHLEALSLLVHTPTNTMRHMLPTTFAMYPTMYVQDHRGAQVFGEVLMPGEGDEDARRVARWPVFLSSDSRRAPTPDEQAKEETEREEQERIRAQQSNLRRSISFPKWIERVSRDWESLPLPPRPKAKR